MFFLIRSAVCIGLVVAALPDGAGALPDRGTLVTAAGHLATSAAGSLCRIAPERCLDVAAAGVPALAGRGRAPRPSRDTLRPTDRRPAWVGPVLLSRN